MNLDRVLDRLAANGIELRRAREGQNRASCPKCHKPRANLAVRIDSEKAIWHCHRCQWKGVAYALSGGPADVPAMRIAESPCNRRTDVNGIVRDIWNATVPVSGTLGEKYLRLRRCLVPAPYADLRFHPALYLVEVGKRVPALIARVSTVVGNRDVGIHRIYLNPKGSDRALAKKRLGSANEPVCIRLSADDDVGHVLSIAEGVETALAAARFYPPVWSTIDAGGHESISCAARD